MRHMKVWFPEYFTEAHRKPGEGDVLAEELRKFGIDCQLQLTADCSFVFCGTRTNHLSRYLGTFRNCYEPDLRVYWT